MWLAYKAVKSLAASKAVSTVSNNVSNKSAPNTSSKLGKLKDTVLNTKLYGNCDDILLDTYETSNKFLEDIPTGVFIAFFIISIIFIILFIIANTRLREYIEMIPDAADLDSHNDNVLNHFPKYHPQNLRQLATTN